ncbi:MAG: hypothetical protein ACE5IR_05145 [bacterium]
MKLLFSEYKSDYANYIFPYAIWAVPEGKESPARFFARGFLPSSRDFERFYLCRQVRVNLQNFTRTSENRRILRKCQDIQFNLVPISDFEFTEEWREFCKHYADIKFGKDVMTRDRLDSLFRSKIVTHVLVFHDSKTEQAVGLVTLYLEKKTLAYYYYAFYDLNYYERNLGMFMMTSAVDYFAAENVNSMYLGTCYSRNALYKTQFRGAEFFNGFQWSQNLKELKYMIERDGSAVTQHLIETEEYCQKFYHGKIHAIGKVSEFTLFLE